MIPENLKKHKSYITGSKVAAILGLSDSYDSAYTLFARMKGATPWPVGNDTMLAGNCAEFAMAEWCRIKYGWDLMEGPKDGAFHPQHSFIFGLVDRLRKGTDGQIDSIVEFKNQDISQLYKWEDGVPLKFEAQVRLYSAIFGLPAQVVACFGGNQYERFSVPRDLEVEEFILEHCHQFWLDLQADRWPEIDYSDGTVATVAHIYKSHSNVMIQGNNELFLCAQEYKEASKNESAAGKRKVLAGNQLKTAIGGALGIDFGGAKVTWKETKPKTPKFNENVFGLDHPELLAEYSELPASSRRLNVKI